MKLNILSILAIGVAFTLPLQAQDPKPAPTPPVETPKVEVLKVGMTVPETQAMKDLDGKAVSFKELRGKVVIVHFWSDRCPAEKHGDPVTKALEKTYAGKDVVILGIASNQNELGAAPPKDADYSKLYTNLRDKIKEVGFTHRVIADHGNVLSGLFQAKSTPHCYVIDQKGVLRYAGALDDNLDESKGEKAKIYVRDAADALLAGKDIEVKETRPYG
ncbi:MAG TPA: redoxin domain-containing protein [Planctomycetota bacterium]|nr:redoxin domain-containing protein [Planctomycetota bacterium]